MKYIKISLLLVFITACFTVDAQTKTGGIILGVESFNRKMQETSGKQVLDVRTPEEFQSGHIKGAVNINFYDEDFKQQLNKLDKGKPVFVYCRSGKRSGKTAAMLNELGFKAVYDLEGGITAWKEAGLPDEEASAE